MCGIGKRLERNDSPAGFTAFRRVPKRLARYPLTHGNATNEIILGDQDPRYETISYVQLSYNNSTEEPTT